MAKYELKIVSALEKIFSDESKIFDYNYTQMSALKGETVSFQVIYTYDGKFTDYAKFEIISPRKESIRVREVVCVPCRYAAHKDFDENYLRTKPGLYPDLLIDLTDSVSVVPNQWKSLWIDFEINEDDEAGEVPLILLMKSLDGEELCRTEFKINVLNAILPKQTLIRTEWLHADCLADYYNIEVFSEKHWEILGNFIRAAVKRGINMILTPQFTPPLDTKIGGERTTTQLVDVFLENGEYSFGFEKLKRWVGLCLDCGVEYIEMSHLFSQWGAKFAPKILAYENGELKRIFGWETIADGEEYKNFLSAYLPKLVEKLKEWGIDSRTYFHISDEPSLEQLNSYKAAKDIVQLFLKGFKIIDAVSEFDFYKSGVCDKIICSNNHVEPFLNAKVPDLWTYYCTSESIDVSNRFFSMPSARTRIYGTQIFKFDIEGILHWGYNFYNSQFSMKHIDPYFITDACEAFPGGDSFLVYPNPDGSANESIRMMLLYQAMTDLRAMQFLASLKSKDYVMHLIENELEFEITFSKYPCDNQYILNLRDRINLEIAACVSE